jgi:hypothetical protein
LINESAFHFCGSWILTTTVFHFPKSTSTVGIPDFFRVCTITRWCVVEVSFYRRMMSTTFLQRSYCIVPAFTLGFSQLHTLSLGTFQVKPPKDVTFFHHGSENLNQIFLMDSPINLKYRYFSSKTHENENSNFRSLLKFSGFP